MAVQRWGSNDRFSQRSPDLACGAVTFVVLALAALALAAATDAALRTWEVPAVLTRAVLYVCAAVAAIIALLTSVGLHTRIELAAGRVRGVGTVLGRPIASWARPLGAPSLRVERVPLSSAWRTVLVLDGGGAVQLGGDASSEECALSDARSVAELLRAEGVQVADPGPALHEPGVLLRARAEPPAWARPGAATDCDCPFCRSSLASSHDVVACAGCATSYHADCARELGRCAVLGCVHAVRERAPVPG